MLGDPTWTAWEQVYPKGYTDRCSETCNRTLYYKRECPNTQRKFECDGEGERNISEGCIGGDCCTSIHFLLCFLLSVCMFESDWSLWKVLN